jgi:hypothetical protein
MDQRKEAAYLRAIGLTGNANKRPVSISARRNREFMDGRIRLAGYDPDALTTDERLDAFIAGCAIKSSVRRVQSAAAKGRRHQRTKLATPAWADLEVIGRIYTEAAKLSEATGLHHEVDHVIPLQGRNVCGLHVHTNLRITTRIENRRKGNRV